MLRLLVAPSVTPYHCRRPSLRQLLLNLRIQTQLLRLLHRVQMHRRIVMRLRRHNRMLLELYSLRKTSRKPGRMQVARLNILLLLLLLLLNLLLLLLVLRLLLLLLLLLLHILLLVFYSIPLRKRLTRRRRRRIPLTRPARRKLAIRIRHTRCTRTNSESPMANLNASQHVSYTKGSKNLKEVVS